ncbi:anti-sigma factor [Burkholderia sp. BCCIQ04A]|uniref:Anti-sigma factor n=1 Tax=Burkholderia anthinoferrum TaxID=3090833 RepID=A0ABU5WSU6_9BURK|nr:MULTISPECIES: anti-sigma factor [Burkholderia]MEB2502352.1 anti-sigma factor [Burkholderia anthinoferrum]MEB2534523.1 anti-sigma factor [Burkholderia anthinoferrum]MEB2562704.1 anti-sigma factor [Burkholderia anthinoferrum]MEB2581563.1 anti-sigma factor [Burkholderia anthinoferrum]MDF3096288.1 anti-sigma factor [Burkholderia semiarida]
MKMDDILLMAYVDGELAPHERAEVDRAIETSAEIAARVALFEASVLPYRRAFERQLVPPVPPRLVREVDGLAHAHAAPAAPFANADDRRAAVPASPPGRSPMRAMVPWLAVAFVAGAFSCGAILRHAPDTAVRGVAAQRESVTAQATMSPWITAAVNYQQLYTRDTVASDASNLAAVARTVDSVHRVDGLPIRIPDLRAAGLTFKRIQRLNFNRKPLVQIVYLPEKGLPVALCVMKDERPDTALGLRQVGNMDVVTWRRASLAYALIAASGETDLGALGERIADDERS